ncbi:MAG TPA: M24 family metallopeptidase, partial [Planctomycetota bacterium]|nr:M24 family metallopeptidase [Planctomycetota bacterium]
MILTPEGCRARVARLRDALGTDWDAAVITLPEHILYLSNWLPDPNSLNFQSYPCLLIERQGGVTLFADNWHAAGVGQPPASESAVVDRVEASEWYGGVTPARLRTRTVAERVAETLRRLGVERLAAETAHVPFEIARAARETRDLEGTLRTLREVKDADEIAAIRLGIRAAEAVHAASRELLRPGIREIDYYAALVERATATIARPFVMMCDLASGPRAAQGGGGPTERVMQSGELVILDIFPYVGGYRGDITNTLVCGGSPSARDRELFAAVKEALEAAERLLRPGTPARVFSAAIEDRFRAFDPAARLVHHAGHAIGLGHPEAPELVPK